jgi:hypothetical protein
MHRRVCNRFTIRRPRGREDKTKKECGVHEISWKMYTVAKIDGFSEIEQLSILE